MKKILGCGCIVILLIVLGVGFIAWRIFGGMSKPKDLGITVTEAQAEEAQTKVGVAVTKLLDSTAVSQSITYEGTHPLTHTMDSQQLTALAASHSKYRYFPFSKIQIRINPDSSVEISCIADTLKAFDYATAVGFAPADLEKAMKDFNIPRTTIPVYAKGSGSVINGKVTLDLQSGNIAGIPVPMGLVNSKKDQIIDVIETGMRKTPGFEAKSLTFTDGKMTFDGMVPEKKFIVE